jgi:hypothetical protein
MVKSEDRGYRTGPVTTPRGYGTEPVTTSPWLQNRTCYNFPVATEQDLLQLPRGYRTETVTVSPTLIFAKSINFYWRLEITPHCAPDKSRS